MIKLALSPLLALALTLSPALADQRAEDPTEATVREVARELRCAVCQNQSVYDSNSELAKDMLEVIRDQARAGRSQAEIREYFFQRYGDYIYLEPTSSGTNALLWWLPAGGVLLGAIALGLALRRWRKTSSPTAAPPSAPTTPANERVRAELERVDW